MKAKSSLRALRLRWPRAAQGPYRPWPKRAIRAGVRSRGAPAAELLGPCGRRRAAGGAWATVGLA